MAEILRRLLWLIPVLALGSLPLFAFLAAGLPPTAEHGVVPLFFNPEPRGIRERVDEVLTELRQGNSPRASDELARLGGAALPHVLPELSRLDAATQARVALALAPVARRTGVARNESALDDPQAAVAFWTRFWQDRALDFQPTVVARLVRRVTTRSNALGSTDLVQLDTYALPELVAQLGAVRTDADVVRVRRLLRVISDITERRWHVPAEATPLEARRVVTDCRRWWDEQRTLYDDVSGLQRLTGTLLQTRYGRWALRTLRELTGLDTSLVGKELLDRLRISGVLLGSVLVGAWFVGSVGAALVAHTRGRVRRVASVASAALLPVLVPAIVLWPPQRWGTRALVSGSIVCLLLGTALTLQLGQRALLSTSALPSVAPRGGARSRFAFLGPALERAPLWTPGLFAHSVPLVFALEWTSGLAGIGPRTLEALRSGDVSWLMAACLTLAAGTACVQIAADAAFARTLRRRASE